MGDLQRVLQGLAEADVRFLVVGGVAVVLHGHMRATADLDLVISLDDANTSRAAVAFEDMGFRPRPPVALRSFADSGERERWATEKNMLVLSLWHPMMPGLEVDLFIREPVDFDDAYTRGSRTMIESTPVVFAAIEDLITMKSGTGRAIDEEDIVALRALEKS